MRRFITGVFAVARRVWCDAWQRPSIGAYRARHCSTWPALRCALAHDLSLALLGMTDCAPRRRARAFHRRVDGSLKSSQRQRRVIRPWLAAFAWRTRLTRRSMWKCQIEVAKQKAALDFFSGTPKRLFEALTRMRKCRRPRAILPRG